MSKFIVKVEHVPSFKEYKIDRVSLSKALPHDRIWQGVRLFDNQYWYVLHEDWGRIFADVLLNMPKYTADRWDCENYSLLTKSRVEEKYRLNAIAIVTGECPRGPHAYCWFYDELGFHQLEPQTGEVGPIDSEGYYAKWLIM